MHGIGLHLHLNSWRFRASRCKMPHCVAPGLGPSTCGSLRVVKACEQHLPHHVLLRLHQRVVRRPYSRSSSKPAARPQVPHRRELPAMRGMRCSARVRLTPRAIPCQHFAAWCVSRSAWRVARVAWCMARGAWRVARGAWCVARGAWRAWRRTCLARRAVSPARGRRAPSGRS